MPTEQYANFPLTTLNGAIDNVVTTITVTSAAGFPTDNQYRIRIDDELMIVTAGAGTTSWTVTRGAEGTTGASHSSGAEVRHILTRDGLKRLGTNLHLIDTFANRPAAGLEGRVSFANNGLYLSRDSGSAWASFAPLFPITEPVSGDFAWINQDSTVLDATRGIITLNKPARATGVSLSIRKKAAPSVPYTVTAAIIPNFPIKTTLHCGLCFRQSSDGKLHTLEVSTNGGQTGFAAISNKYTTEVLFSAEYTRRNIEFCSSIIFLRIADNNTNRILSVSFDGFEFFTLDTQTRTDFLTADEVGFWIDSENAATPNFSAAMALLSWVEG